MIGRALIVLLVLSATSIAFAQPAEDETSPPPAPSREDERLAEAKGLFEEGNALRRAGDCAGALVRYTASRALVRSVPNTINAAYCLDKLGRYDEALEMYEELITKLGAELSDEQRAAVAPEMARLRQQLASLELSSNVPGSLTIDGRPRGELPRLTPVRVLPGRRLVMVSQNGFRTFEQTLTVKAGETLAVRASLEPLTVVGRASLRDRALAGAEVFIDGARVGTVPWEGMLEPGRHFFFVQRGGFGSAPAAFVVVKGQIATLSAALRPLGPMLTITTTPPSAMLRIGDVLVGNGRWRGRLPIGEHTLLAREEGYFDQRLELSVGAEMRDAVELRLTTDEAHARWGVAQGVFLLDALGGLAIAPGFGSGAETSCGTSATCGDDPAALGFVLGARGGYEFPFGLSVAIAGGYLRAAKTLERTATRPPDITYALRDGLRVSGPFGMAGLGYRQPLAPIVELRVHALAGAFYAFASDDMTAVASRGAETTKTRIVDSGVASGAPAVIVMPSVELGLRLDDFGVGLGLAALIVALDGPAQKNGEIAVDGSEGCAAGDLTCVKNYDGVAGELAFGPFVMITPTLTAGYQF